MRSRAVLLPHFGDPACLYYWLGWFSSTLHKEVDALYVYSSNILNKEHEAVLASMIIAAEKDTGVPCYFFPSLAPVQHGTAIANMMVMCKEDLVVLMEEDTIVHKEGHVDAAFKRIESGEVDAVGSRRASCADIITKKCAEKFGPIPQPDDSFDVGYNFWPNFFFAKKKDLLRTDGNFNAFGRSKGMAIPEIGIDRLEDDVAGDTFVWASIQLRNMGLKFGYVEQYHGHPDDPTHYRLHKNVFDPRAGWVHHGSLSGWRDMIADEPVLTEGVDPNEMARRLQWYKTFIEFFEQTKLLHRFVEKYKSGIRAHAMLYGISMNQLEKRQLIYKKLFEGTIP